MREIGIFGFVDMAVMAVLLYAVLVWFKRTKSLFVLVGILMISGLYFLAQLFSMQLTTAVLNGFFAVILVAMVVIFQEELRHFFEQIAVWGMGRRQNRQPAAGASAREEVSVLVRTLSDLARGRVGALVVLKGRDALGRHLEGEVELAGKLSEPLLKSIFDPHSIGHDGAVVVERNRVQSFGARLPLSKNLAVIGGGGTRHAAALGLSELTDAHVLVVSEERGTVSVASGSSLRAMAGTDELARSIEDFYSKTFPAPKRMRWQFFSSNNLEKLIAISLSALLWFVFVHESVPVYRSYVRTVKRIDLPDTLRVKNVKPATVRLTFSGPRRSFYLVDSRKIKLSLKVYNAHIGMNTVQVGLSSVAIPPGLEFENADPPMIRVWVEKNTVPKP